MLSQLQEPTSAGEGGGVARGDGAERIRSRDYKAWDRFDVEVECAKVEDGGGGAGEKGSGTQEETTTAAAERKVFHRGERPSNSL